MARPEPTARWRLPEFSSPETRSAAWLFVYNFLVMSAFTAVKPARNALLLDRLGPAWLPVGFIGAALATGLLVYTVGWFADRVPPQHRVFVTTLTLSLNLLVFRALFEVGRGAGRAAAGPGLSLAALKTGWVALAFYVWANLFASILTTQFWLVAGSRFTLRDAKRMVGWVSAGGLAGAVVGPAVAFRAVGAFGTENLVCISALLLVGCLPIVRHLEGGSRPPAFGRTPAPDAGSAPDAGLGLFREFRHLKLIAIISGVSIVVQTILDYQFNAIVAVAFVTKDAKAAFFAQFFAVLNLASLLIQLLLTRFILLRFGIGVALLMLPLALVTGSVGILLYPTLMVVALARLGEAGVRYSVQEAVREILYQPLPASVRSRARPLIEIFGSRLFEGLAGLMIVVSGLFHLTVRHLSLLSISLISVWLLAVLAVKKEYLEALRKLFSELPAESRDRAAEVLDPETVGILVQSLKNPDEVRVAQALTMLDLMHDKSAIMPQLRQAMSHSSASVRTQVLSLLRKAGEDGFVRQAELLLEVADPKVRVEAVRYLSRFGDPATRSNVTAFLHDADPRLRVAAIAGIAGSDVSRNLEMRAAVEACIRHPAPEAVRVEATLLLGTLNDPCWDDLLICLLRDPSPQVVQAALEGVERTGRRTFIALVMPYLAHEGLMLYAQRTIRSYGNRVLGTLHDYLDDPDEPEALRRAVPGCFAAIGTQQAADALTAALRRHLRELGDEIVEALGEMRARRPDLRFEVARVEAALLQWVETPLSPSGCGPEANRPLRLIVGLLALIYPFQDIYRAYAGLTSGRRDLKAGAVELLDNLLRPELKRAILPYLEAWAPPATGL